MSILAKESGKPVTNKAQLVAYFADAGKPASQWRIGCEHEKFAYRLSTLKPVSYDEPNGLRDFLNGMKAYGWNAAMEGDTIIGLTRDKCAITFEPGGQVELGGAPLTTLHEVATETDQHLTEVNAVGGKLGIGFLGMGFHPTTRLDGIPLVPKERYYIQQEEMPKRGSMALDMMKRTCTVQVNLDYADEADMVQKFRVSLALQPIATALFSTSPFREGKPSGFNSMRMHVWTDVDRDRCGSPQFVFDAGFGYERYVDYALDVPMQFVYRDGHHINCYGQSFRDFMAGKLPALPGAHPTMTDWANHLTTLFPDVRLKKILEMRGADSGPAAMLVALPAFWTGLLYDRQSLDDAAQMLKDWTAEERLKLVADTAQHGFKASIHGQNVAQLAKACIRLSRDGLRRRNYAQGNLKDETGYLDVLSELAERGQNTADEMLARYNASAIAGMSWAFDAMRLRCHTDANTRDAKAI